MCKFEASYEGDGNRSNDNIEVIHILDLDDESDDEQDFKPLQNLHFLVTFSVNLGQGDAQEGEEGCVSVSPAFRTRLVTKIYKYGGIPYSEVADIDESLFPYCYVITDTYCKTANYFMGVINGLRAYHYKYIDISMEQKKPFTEVIAGVQPFPFGYSLETKQTVPFRPGVRFSQLLSNYVVYISAPVQECGDFYASLIRICGGMAHTIWQNVTVSTDRITIIITDEKRVEQLREINVPKLSYNWLLQTLIHGEVRPMDAIRDYILT